MPGATPRLPDLYQPIQMAPGQDFHVSELAADAPGAMSPFGPDVELPLALTRLNYQHPTRDELPRRAGVER